MNRPTTLWRFAALLGVALFAFAPAARANLSFTGAFAHDDDVQTFGFTLVVPQVVTLISYSYAGGTNAIGQAIPRGGFDPILSLFDGSGALVASNDDGAFPDVGIDLVTGMSFDSFLTLLLLPGNYSVAITEMDNFAIGPTFADGFTRQGQGDFTGALFGPGSGSFFDATGDQRTSNFAFDVLVTATPVPEPSSGALLVGGLLALAWCRWRSAPVVRRPHSHGLLGKPERLHEFIFRPSAG